MDDVLTLVSYVRTQDDYGIWKEQVAQTRTVFCKCESVTRSEFFEGGRNGLNPELVFIVQKVDYEGERECVFHGKTYGIYRTYVTDEDYMELYAERKGGTNGKADESGEVIC